MRITETIITCLEQRVLLMTEILNLCKQIDVQLQQEEPDIEDLLRTRKSCMDRIDKCSVLLAKELEQLPENQASHIRQLITAETSPETLSDQDSKIVSQAIRYQELLNASVSLDEKANNRLNIRREQLKKAINDLRLPHANQLHK